MKSKKLTSILLGIYVIIISWIIVFKMQFNFDYLPYIRSINFIPFGESVIVNGKIYFGEIINNLIVFIPVGLYIGMIWKDKKLLKKVIPILSLTLIFECLQYIFHIGATDITDIIMNTSGGVIGILVINCLYKIFKNSEKVDKVLNILATICTIGVIGLITILIISNL